MDSINIIKGYGKLNSINVEDNKHHQTTTTTRNKPPTTTVIAIISLLVITLIIGLFLTALIHESDDNDDDDDFLSATEAIQKVCSVTRYPSSCFTSLSSCKLKKPDPVTIFKFSLQVTNRELTRVSSQFKSLNDASSKAAVDDCVSLFDDAVKSVNDSVTAMEFSRGETKKEKKMLTSEKVNDIRTWISAAMTDQETCLDGLNEMDQNGSVALREVRVSMDRCKEFLSNSLAIVTNMHSLLEKFNPDED